MKMNLHLPSFDSLFISEESNEEKITKIKINEIVDFENHPFHVKMEDDMVKLIDSIQENGQLMPMLVRPNKNGKGYEMIAGHRRKFALTQIGVKEIDAIVRELDDDQAVILMVDSNVQREYISPTEKGYAYKMRLEAMKHQGKRNDLTSTQVGQKLEYRKKYSIENLAEAVRESRNQVQRYIRLTELIKPLQDMVDGIDEKGFNISFNPAYVLSFLTKQHQQIVVEKINLHEKVYLNYYPMKKQIKKLKYRLTWKISINLFLNYIHRNNVAIQYSNCWKNGRKIVNEVQMNASFYKIKICKFTLFGLE